MCYLEIFEKTFKKYKQKNIVLYGIGIKTQEILKHFDFNFIGLMDKDPTNIGKIFYGLKTLSEDEVIKKADIVIIVSSDIYFEIIFSRIEFLIKKHKIPIFFCNGKKAKVYTIDKEIEDNTYWLNNYTKLANEIDKHKIISFDIFDTIVMRRIFEPTDIFLIIENQLKDTSFSKHRISTELSLGPSATLKKIYEQLVSINPKYEIAYSLELDFEKKLLILRNEIYDIYKYAISKNKTIYFITDIFHPKDYIVEILNNFGIYKYNDILVSCELSKRKSDGTLWRYYKELIEGNNALHIGDNIYSDIKNAKKQSLSTFHIYNSYDLLKNSTLKNILPKVCTIDESIIIGNIISKIFNSPFSLSNQKGHPSFNSFEDIGYVFFAPILFNYIIWIIQENIKKNIKRIFFVARDGYFLIQLYNFIIDYYNIKNAPKAIYLVISRSIATIVNIKDEKDIKDLLNIKFEGKICDYFKIRFGINIKEDYFINTSIDLDKIQNILNINKIKILKNAKKQRSLYLKYINQFITNDDNISIVDPSYNGTIQFNISKLLNKQIEGYYCNANLSNDNKYNIKNMYALFQSNSDLKAELSNIRKNTVFFEDGILVAPTGTPLRIKNDLTFEYSDLQYTQRNFLEKEEIYTGIINFFKHSIVNYTTINDINLTNEFVDFLFGELCSKKVSISQDIKDKFYFDTLYEKFDEGKIFA